METNPPCRTSTSRASDRDPRRSRPSSTVREGDFVLLHFGDGRQIITQCQEHSSKSTLLRINKRTYPTNNLVGLPYGTVLEQEMSKLTPLPDTAKLIPELPDFNNAKLAEATNDAANASSSDRKDNSSLLDDNTAQTLDQDDLTKMRESGTKGADIVQSIVKNSSTFNEKTVYAQAKYVVRKQKKYQPRCRIVRCIGATIVEALYLKDPRKTMNLRQDTLGQILSYANLSAGCQTIIVETCMGVVTGAVAQRMGGYGTILSMYTGQQPSFTDMLNKFNLSFCENMTIKWWHAGDVFGESSTMAETGPEVAAVVAAQDDPEGNDRDALEWPCTLQSHTRKYVATELVDSNKRIAFLKKRAARFVRKLCRHTPQEALVFLTKKQSDSIIMVAKYDPTETLLKLLPYLAPSCPFVVFCEFLEPLTSCFRRLQEEELAINLRLADTWMREYQVLPGRTHPNMNMSQSGGFVLTGIKLDPKTGRNELGEELLKEIKAQLPGRRGKKKTKKDADPSNKDAPNAKRQKN